MLIVYVVFQPNKSVKKSFRERGGETAYWMVKKKESNKPYEPQKRNKWRSILTSEILGKRVLEI